MPNETCHSKEAQSHSEFAETDSGPQADPAALLTFLVLFGSAAGPGARAAFGKASQPGREFLWPAPRPAPACMPRNRGGRGGQAPTGPPGERPQRGAQRRTRSINASELGRPGEGSAACAENGVITLGAAGAPWTRDLRRRPPVSYSFFCPVGVDGLSRSIQQWPSAGPIFQARRPVSVAGRSLPLQG